MADLIKPWQQIHYIHFSRIIECAVIALGKDKAGIHTLMVSAVINKQRIPYKIVTRTEDFPQGIPPGYINVGHIL